MHHKMRLALENNKRISFENMLSIGVQKGIFGSSIERVGLFDTDADGQTLLHFAAKRGWLKSFLDAVMGDDVYKICIREGAAIDRTSPEDQKAAARKYILKFLLKPTIIPKAPSNNLDTTASDNAPIIPNDTTALDIELNNGKYETFVYINDKFSELWRPSSRLSNKFHMIVKTAAEAKIRALADPQEVAAILEAQAQDPNESLVVVRPDTPPQKDTVELFIKLFENNYISILNEEEKFEIMQKLVRLLNVVSLHDNEYWKIHPGQLQAIINHDGRGSIVDATKKYILRVAALASLNGTLETFELDNFLPALIPLLDHEGETKVRSERRAFENKNTKRRIRRKIRAICT
ncbi:MAG UNVERIFIED_CONTAM: hypothetical protein LVQ98_02235 [Rickettsiaceae bacterium]|jgi:hypothetical protein